MTRMHPLAVILATTLLAACSKPETEIEAPQAAAPEPAIAAEPEPVHRYGSVGQLGLDGQPSPLQSGWFTQGQSQLKSMMELTPLTERPRNVVLFVGDGMSATTVAAARILAGQLQGRPGEDHQLSFDAFPFTAMVKTYNTDAQTPDSAGTMTAMMTGVKTRAGLLGVDENVNRRNCAEFREHRLMSAMMLAAEAGLGTGVVTNTRITHATPAATFAWSPDRNYESDADLTNWGKQVGCVDIASQLISFDYGRGLDVAFGGGRAQFLPEDQADPIYPGAGGKRKDGRNLTQEWQQRHAQSLYIHTKAELEDLPVEAGVQVLGLFAPSHNEYRVDRQDSETHSSLQPSLKAMTLKAIELLKAQGDEGFLLVVESGRIDHGHHAGQAHRALHEVIELDEAVAATLGAVGDDTLVLVTADHSHTMTFAGYSAAGNNILGLAGRTDANGEFIPTLDSDGQPYTTLAYANGPGARYPTATLTAEQVVQKDYRQRAITPLNSETHGGEDVVLYATGPGAQLARGTLEQNLVFHLIDAALGLSEQAAK